MKVGDMSLPDSLGQWDFEAFKKYYAKVCKDNLTQSVEEVYEMLGGKLPHSKTKKVEKPTE